MWMRGAATRILDGHCKGVVNRSTSSPRSGHPVFGWSLQVYVHHRFLPVRYDHPDFGWSLQHVFRAIFIAPSAATLILGGHCNRNGSGTYTRPGAATLIGWSLQPLSRAPHHPHRCGHPDFGWSLQRFRVACGLLPGTATRILGGHCNCLTPADVYARGAAALFSVVIATSPPCPRLPSRCGHPVLGGHCNWIPLCQRCFTGAATAIWVVIATAGAHWKVSCSVRPPGFRVVIATFLSTRRCPATVRPPCFGWSL